MVANGFRRSWETAASTAVRTLSACRSRSPCSASRVSRSRSTASTAWAANTSTSRWSDGGSGRPYIASSQPGSRARPAGRHRDVGQIRVDHGGQPAATSVAGAVRPPGTRRADSPVFDSNATDVI